MIRNLNVWFSRSSAAFAMLLGTVFMAQAPAQSTPEVREILQRLDRLEKDNQALLEEVRELRKQLGATANREQPGSPAGADPAPAAEQDPAPAPAQEVTREEIGIQQARIEELTQTKIEASQKFPIRLTGMALFNAYVNGRANGGLDNPTTASRTSGLATGGATLRQSILGFEYRGPQTLLGGKVSGSLYMDLFGGSTSAINHLLRLRTATINFDWKNTSLLVGQDKPIISPRNPDSLAQVGVSPLTDAGNLWLWQPQVRLEQRVYLGHNGGVRAQLGVFQTALLGDSGEYSGYSEVGTGLIGEVRHDRPGVEGRFEVWRRWGENRRIEIAPGFHYNRSYVGHYAVPASLFSIDWLIKPAQKFEFSGAFFNGQNVENLGGLGQGFTILRRYSVIPVHATGGWAQIRIPVTERLAVGFYGGREDDRDFDLLAGSIGKNQAYAGNVMYRFAPNVIVSLETGQVRTTYIGMGNRLNNHYDLAVAYLF